MRFTPVTFYSFSAAAFLILAGARVSAVQQPCSVQAPCAAFAESQPASGAIASVPEGEGPEQARKKNTAPSVPQTGAISGTVADTNGDIIPGATVQLDGAARADRQTLTANDNAAFEFKGLKAGVAYRVTVTAPGFENWVSPAITLTTGQYFDLTGIQLKIAATVSSVTVYSSTEQIATQQIIVEEQQRVLGFIPNFYVVYDAKNAVPMTAKLKFQMAMRVSIDPISIIGAAALAGMNQAGDTPDYQQGIKGYGQRFGASYADGVTDIMFGGAILPSLLRQDPRYFYQGTGTVKSRTLHALANPFICRGDNGKQQVNFSSMGGDLISASLSNTYYPTANRGASFVFSQFLLSTAEREVSSLMQEFVIRKFTPSAKKNNP